MGWDGDISTRGEEESMRMAERIERKLKAEFAPEMLTVTDDSDKHHGHAGWREGGETHFSVAVVSQAFAGKSRIERHRMINQALAEELAGGVHALAIAAKAPGER
jgi:BolA protein